VSLDATLFFRHYSMLSGHDLDIWPLTLRISSAMPTHIVNVYVKFYWNLTTT